MDAFYTKKNDIICCKYFGLCGSLQAKDMEKKKFHIENKTQKHMENKRLDYS